MAYKPISDYGLIGNLNTCALVGRDGSIDWCCMPHLDSSSIFAAILDQAKGGHFRVSPGGEGKGEQAYLTNTNVLETSFQTETGLLMVTDFMPMTGRRAEIHRIVKCIKGEVDVEVEYAPRFNYGKGSTRLKRINGGLKAAGRGETAILTSRFPFDVRGGEARARFKLRGGEEEKLILHYGNMDPPSIMNEALEEMERTVSYWHHWVHRCERGECVFDGPWHDQVVRSALALKLLITEETGSIAAAATTSLPEEVGGTRNWDYRFTWIRDASFTVQALFNLGHMSEATSFLQWLRKIYLRHRNPSRIQIMYGLRGETDLKEKILKHLEGYRGSSPVRRGNGAVKQRQLDIYGELLDVAANIGIYGGGEITEEDWDLLRRIVDHACQAWMEPDSGIWEVRGGMRHFVHSKVMCWVALDRGIQLARSRGFPADLERWERTREEIRSAVLTEGYSEKKGAFVQSFGSEELDASSLLIPLVGFLPVEDLRVQGTINAVQRDLTRDGLVMRYTASDGLSGGEGAFGLCTFWLVDCLTLSGRIEEAKEIFLKMMKYANHLGLFSEEIDVRTGEALGNFPQAFTHIGFINSALYMGCMAGKQCMGPLPMGCKT